MAIKLSILLFLASSTVYSKTNAPRAVYGKDSRKDIYEVRNPLYLELAESTAGLVDNHMLKRSKDRKTYFFNGDLFTLEKGLRLCSSEKFAKQPMLTNCSGFLIAENKIMTAGHCYADFEDMDSCGSSSWVFGLQMEGPNYINTQNIPADNVYRCKKILHMKSDDILDFAIIELDRNVVGRSPLKYRTEGKIADEAELVAIGHPSMLPLKVADGASILDNQGQLAFVANLDTFQGNSGSAVFDSNTGLVEGILISGKTDYIMTNPKDGRSCQVVNICDEDGLNCKGEDFGSLFIPGESVLRISILKDLI